MKLSRKALKEGINSVPISHILGADVSRQLTAKQRNFAHEIAKGSTKADAYRTAYNVTSEASTRNDPYRIAADPRIALEIEAYTLALEAAKHRTPTALRELVIQSLVKVIVDPDSKPGQITAAAKVLGTVTEVAAFTERREVRNITSSEDARTRVMQELRGLLTSGATDATIIEADSLLAELAGNITDDERNITQGQDEGSERNITGGARNITQAQDADPPYPDPPPHDSGVPPP
jgi:hypothetical protein